MAARRANIQSTAMRNFRANTRQNPRNPYGNMPMTRAINAALRGRSTAGRGGAGGGTGGSGG